MNLTGQINGAPPSGGVPVSSGQGVPVLLGSLKHPTASDYRRAIASLRAQGKPITPDNLSCADVSKVYGTPHRGLSTLPISFEHESSGLHDRSCLTERQVNRLIKREYWAARETRTSLRTPGCDVGVLHTRKDGTVHIVGRELRNAKGLREPNRAPPPRGVCDLGKARMACIVNDCNGRPNDSITTLSRVLPKRTIPL